MNKPVFAMLLGGFLGVFDGLSALISGGPEIPSTIGAHRGRLHVQGRRLPAPSSAWWRRKTQSMAMIVASAWRSARSSPTWSRIGSPYLWEIVLPGSIVGLIVGFATAKYRGPVRSSTA